MIVSEGHNNPGTDMTDEEPISRAKELVKQAVDYRLMRTPGFNGELTAYEVRVVWFTYVLGAWKALVSTDMDDGMYYEVTHNIAKQESYIDEYKKVRNIVIPD